MIREADNPIHKDNVCGELFGEFVGFVKLKGLTKGKEYETDKREIFQCSKRILWIDQYNEKLQMTLCINSIDLSLEFGLVEKTTKKVLTREKLENLRYKISTGTNMELIESHQVLFNEFFEKFKTTFKKLEP